MSEVPLQAQSHICVRTTTFERRTGVRHNILGHKTLVNTCPVSDIPGAAEKAPFRGCDGPHGVALFLNATFRGRERGNGMCSESMKRLFPFSCLIALKPRVE